MDRHAVCHSFEDVEFHLGHVRPKHSFDIIWHYEELRCPGTDDVVDERLSRMDEGEALTGHYIAKMSFAPMAERLLAFRRLGVIFWPRLMPVAEQLLGEGQLVMPQEPDADCLCAG